MPNSLQLSRSEKVSVFPEVEEYLKRLNLTIVAKDFERPWGGFFVLDESQAQAFGGLFFPNLKIADLRISGKLSPKILVVQPGMRLSWQYHHRRAEIWRVVYGKVGVTLSDTDVEAEKVELSPGDSISLRQGQRHRLRGLDGWGVVAEIWQHTDTERPSDENEIVRLQDDFGR